MISLQTQKSLSARSAELTSIQQSLGESTLASQSAVAEKEQQASELRQKLERVQHYFYSYMLLTSFFKH